ALDGFLELVGFHQGNGLQEGALQGFFPKPQAPQMVDQSWARLEYDVEPSRGYAKGQSLIPDTCQVGYRSRRLSERHLCLVEPPRCFRNIPKLAACNSHEECKFPQKVGVFLGSRGGLVLKISMDARTYISHRDR